MKKKRKKYDALWKGVVEEVFSELLEFVFPDHVDMLDLDRGVEFLDKELGELFPAPGRRLEVRYVDKLVKVFRKDGTEEYLIIHVEVQGEYDENFARRMFEYYCRLYVRFKRPVEAVAIFTHKEGLRMPEHCEQAALVTKMRLDYKTLYLASLDDFA
ncbi:MAG: hypothetical protein JST68_03820 [Bacteroidetes bacterium]|nr:hypothetical protein [Bacteroidota bacterium]